MHLSLNVTEYQLREIDAFNSMKFQNNVQYIEGVLKVFLLGLLIFTFLFLSSYGLHSSIKFGFHDYERFQKLNH